MRGVRMWVVSFVVIAGAGCGDDGAGIVEVVDAMPPDAMIPIDAAIADARPANLACNTDPIPASADDPINAGGNAIGISLNGAAAIEGATAEVRSFADPDGTPLGTAMSDANGDFTIPLVTGGTPADVFMRVTSPNNLPTEVWSPTVVTEDVTAPAPQFEMGTITLLAQFSGQSQDLGNNGIAVVLLVDCDQNPIEGATVIPPSGAGGIVYNGSNGLPDTSLDQTSTAGAAIIFDIPPGTDVVFDAEVMGMSLRDNHARIAAGTVSAIAIAPGLPPGT